MSTEHPLENLPPYNIVTAVLCNLFVLRKLKIQQYSKIISAQTFWHRWMNKYKCGAMFRSAKIFPGKMKPYCTYDFKERVQNTHIYLRWCRLKRRAKILLQYVAYTHRNTTKNDQGIVQRYVLLIDASRVWSDYSVCSKHTHRLLLELVFVMLERKRQKITNSSCGSHSILII